MQGGARVGVLILYPDSGALACKQSVNSAGVNFLKKLPNPARLEANLRRGYVVSARASYRLPTVDLEERP